MLLQTKRKTLDLSGRTAVMGILNVTPDSFFDGGKYVTVEHAVARAKQMVAEGADIIDIGGESTASYTGVKSISADEELQRVVPVISALRKSFGDDIILSLDTYKSPVAKKALAMGVAMINDPSGLQLDEEMLKVVAKAKATIIINHMQGNPQTMFQETFHHADIIHDLEHFFTSKIALLKDGGVSQEHIILDPGFGFRKSVKQNIEMLKGLGTLKKFDMPIMIGISRKSTIGKFLSEAFGRDYPPLERLEGSLAATAVAVLNGASIIRTHDIAQTKKFLAVLDKIRSSP